MLELNLLDVESRLDAQDISANSLQIDYSVGYEVGFLSYSIVAARDNFGEHLILKIVQSKPEMYLLDSKGLSHHFVPPLLIDFVEIYALLRSSLGEASRLTDNNEIVRTGTLRIISHGGRFILNTRLSIDRASETVEIIIDLSEYEH